MVKIQVDQQKIQVSSPTYGWEWDGATDLFSLFDSEQHLIARAQHQPFVISIGKNPRAETNSFEIKDNHVLIHYSRMNGASGLTVSWLFKTDFSSLEPLRYESSAAEEIVQVVYFPAADGDSYKPSFYSRYAVVPGLSMSTNISPVVDLHSRLNVSAVLGSGAMRGPGFTQQWGLPAHYFCTFNTSERWNAIGAKGLQSGAACWGLAELPQGDFRLEIREIGLSPVLNLRSDLWKQLKTPGTIQLGLHSSSPSARNIMKRFAITTKFFCAKRSFNPNQIRQRKTMFYLHRNITPGVLNLPKPCSPKS